MKLKVRNFNNAAIDIATETGVFVAAIKFRAKLEDNDFRMSREEALHLATEIVKRFNAKETNEPKKSEDFKSFGEWKGPLDWTPCYCDDCNGKRSISDHRANG